MLEIFRSGIIYFTAWLPTDLYPTERSQTGTMRARRYDLRNVLLKVKGHLWSRDIKV